MGEKRQLHLLDKTIITRVFRPHFSAHKLYHPFQYQTEVIIFHILFLVSRNPLMPKS